MKTSNLTALSSLIFLVPIAPVPLMGCSAKVNGFVSMGGDTGGASGTGGNLGAIGGGVTQGLGGAGGASGSGTPGGQCSNGGASGLTGGMTLLSDATYNGFIVAACTGAEYASSVPLIDFVVDVSGSMTDVALGSSAGSKWQVTRDALSHAIATALPDSAGVGMLFYPNMQTVPNHNTAPIDVTNCVNTGAMIPAAPLGAAGSAQRSAIAQGLANATLAGGTPTDDAYRFAFNNSVIPALQTYGYFTPSIVLITDGQPTISLGCEGTGQEAYPVDWHPVVADIATAFAANPSVKTYIIGLPGSEAQSSTGADGRPWLSEAARTGGTHSTPDCQDTGPNYCHYDMSQAADFATGLTQAISDVISNITATTASTPCNMTIPPPTGQTIDTSKIAVVYTSNPVSSGTTQAQYWLIGQSNPCCSGSNGDGWYLDPDTGNITLCPKTCKTIQSDTSAVISIRAECTTILPPPT